MLNAQLERLCRGSSGVFRLIAGLDEIGPAVKLFHQSFKSEYFLEFALPEGESREKALVSIQAYNALAVGETTLELMQQQAQAPELVESVL